MFFWKQEEQNQIFQACPSFLAAKFSQENTDQEECQGIFTVLKEKHLTTKNDVTGKLIFQKKKKKW